VDGSGEATARPRPEGRNLEPSTSGVGASASEGDVASGSATRRASEHQGNAGESAYRKQTCRLCKRDTLYITRSGLSNHAVVHHNCWYSAVRDEFVPIPEEELEKRRAVQRGQTHRRRRPDPMLTQRARERAFGSSGGNKSSTSGSRAPTKRKGIGEFVIPKLTPCRQDTRLETSGRDARRPVTYAESRPTGKGKGKRRDERRERSPTSSSSSGEYWKPPPSKSRRPEGFPEVGTGIAQSQPPPPEDDASGVGWDDSGMAPKVTDVVLTEE